MDLERRDRKELEDCPAVTSNFCDGLRADP